MKPRPLAIVVFLALMPLQRAHATTPAPLFADPLDGGTVAAAWRRAPEAASFVDAPDGRQALRYERGATWNAATQPWAGDESWGSCRIEVEILPEKMWAGIDFCVADDGASACNLTLFRGEDDRLTFELAGLWGPACSWKLYPMGQQRPAYVPGTWVKLRVDVGGGVANIHVDGSADPVASFRDLPRERGGVRLMTYYGSALFRNLRVTALPAGTVRPVLEDPWALARAPGAGVVREWQVTARHDADWAADAVPAELREAAIAWHPAPTDARGVIDLTRIFTPQNENGVVLARTTLEAAAAGKRALRFTYTDNFTLWCNGERVFVGPPRQWFHPDREKYGNSRLIPDQFELVVPVRAGENELLVRTEITERFGWGVWMRLVDPAGRAVENPET
jgi:hypothetical protein